MLRRFYQSLFFGRRFYITLAVLIFLFALSYGMPFLFTPARIVVAVTGILVLLDFIILFTMREPLSVVREVEERLSNGDENFVRLEVANNYSFPVSVNIIDELPDQLQERNFRLSVNLKGGEEQSLQYHVRPTSRGEYEFHDINVFIRTALGFVVRRKKIKAAKTVKVYPSFFTLRKFELLAHSGSLVESGNKRVPKLGHSLEFEQIKEYVPGDDVRNINWKATGRRGGQLMVNNYTAERSQQVYCVIDKGRVMKMPFDGLSLLDYSINAALVLSRVALLKQDKAGLVTFSEKMGSFLPAGNKAVQMTNILESLYNQQTNFKESDYEKLYALVRTRITQRCLVVLFTNFESLSSLQRQLPYMRAIAKTHLLLVVFFENTALRELTDQPATDVEMLYTKTIAEKFRYEKRLIVKELQQHGIATILTTPANLSINTINKYLEIKSRRAI